MNRCKYTLYEKKRDTLVPWRQIMSERYPMNYHWRFCLDDDERFSLPDFDDSAWQIVDIPHSMMSMPLQYHEQTVKHYIGWYRTVIDLSEVTYRENLRLRFEGVSVHATIYLQGVRAGEHVGAFTPFELAVPEQLIEADAVLVAVRCDATENPETPPFGHVVDYMVPGGIYREVALLAYSCEWIEQVAVRSEPAQQNEYRTIRVEVTLGGVDDRGTTGTLTVEVLDDTHALCASTEEQLFGSPVVVILPIGPVTRWDIDRPALYTVIVHVRTLRGADTYTVRTGFRDIEWDEQGLVLNGNLVKLRAMNRHQLYPYVGFAMPKRQQDRDADFLKYELQVNCVRTSHYPQSPHFLQRCDEIGLLVFEEIPGWQHIGPSELWRDRLVQQLKEMIVRDRNHPSIIMWGVRVNESADDDTLYARTNEMARMLDPTRATGGVRNFAGSSLLEEVYTYNDFSYAGEKKALASAHAITRDRRVPYIVTEHTGHLFPCRQGDPEVIRTEHALRHADVLQAMYRNRRIGGAFGWCMSDYHTHSQFGGGDGVCYHGVSDMFRIPKLAGALYRSQGDAQWVLEVSSSLRIGAVPAHALNDVWVFTNCAQVQVLYNGTVVGVFLPDRKRFPDMPHPPVRIDDLIGGRIEELASLTTKEQRTVRELLNLAVSHGFDLPLTRKIALARIMHRHRMCMDDAVRMFERFVMFWDGSPQLWTFNGIVEDRIVTTRIVAPPSTPRLVLLSDTDHLTLGETYDVVRCIIRMEDHHGQLLRESNAPVTISVSGPIDLIGPATVTLSGGVTGFYVRTVGERGVCTIHLLSAGVASANLSLSVD